MADQLATIAQVKARLQTPSGVGVTFTATDNTLLTELIEQVSDWIEHYTMRKLVPENGATKVFDTIGGYVLRIPRGIRTVTAMGIATMVHQPDTGGTYTALTVPGAILLRPAEGERPFGWPATEIRLSRVNTAVFGTIENGATVTGDFGFAATPPDIQAVTIDAVVAAWQSRKSGASGVIGEDGTPVIPWASFFTKGSPQRATLDRYAYIGFA